MQETTGIDFTTIMNRAFIAGTEIMLLGNFNIDLNKSNQVWNDMILLCNLQQLISCPTRVTETSLTLTDNIYVSCPQNIIECSVSVSAISDLYPICCI